MARDAYFWAWPMANIYKKRLGFGKAPEPGLRGGVLPFAPVNRMAMLADYIDPAERAVACPNQDVVYGGGPLALDVSPVVVQVPDFGRRFWVYQIVDVRTDSFADLGAMCGTKPGFYLAWTLPDSKGALGPRGKVDPVRRLVRTAAAWGGNPERDATYLTVTPPPRNDSKTVYELSVRNVPVDGFWSISRYNAQGYFEKNGYNAYTLNNITARKEADGAVNVQFGGCDGKIPTSLPTMQGWNHLVRLYRPRAEILNTTWKFPEPPVN